MRSDILLLSILTLLFSATVKAQEDGLVYIGTTSSDELAPPVSEIKRTKLSAGFKYYQYDFKEQIPLPKKSMEKGSLPGIQIEGEHNFSEEIDSPALQARFEYSSGTMKYDGSLQNNVGEYVGDATATTPTHIYDFQGRYIHNIDVDRSDRRFDFLVGYGYHRWFRGTDGTPGGYNVDYTWHYIPFGVRADLLKNDLWQLRLQGDLKLIFDGKAKASVSKVDPQLSDMTLPLGSGSAFRIEISAERRLPDNWAIKLAPWYEQTNISRGKWVQSYRNGQPEENSLGRIGAYEPASRTHIYGAELNFSRLF